MLCGRVAHCRLHGTVAVVTMAMSQGMARNEAREHKQRQHTGDETMEDEDYLTHEDPRGTGEHTWNQGRQSDT